ncbi:MAG: hypothetical protein AAFZ09_07815 [Pseudomonadota bacterium]
MEWSPIFLLVSALAALARFANYALEPKLGGQPLVAPTPLVGLAPAPRISFTLRALVSLRRFIVENFGERYFSLAKFLKIAAVAAFVVLGVFITSHAISDTAWRAPAESAVAGSTPLGLRLAAVAGCLLALIFFNALFDSLAVATVRSFLEPFDVHRLCDRRKAGLRWRLALLPIYLAVLWLLFCATVSAAFSVIITIRGSVAGYPLLATFEAFWGVQGQLLETETLPRLVDPIGEATSIAVGTGNLLYFCMTPLLPLFMITAAVVGGVLLDAVDLSSNGKVTARLAAHVDDRGSRWVAVALILSVVGGAIGALVPL